MDLRLQLMTRYTRLGASSRLRMLQYRPALEQAGFELADTPYFDDDYLQRLYRAESTWGSIPRSIRRRWFALRAQPSPDLIWLEYEALPWMPWRVEGALWPRGVPVVADYDDAIFHRYDLHRSLAVRRALGRKVDHVMARANLVTAGNEYLAERAHAAGAKRVEIVPTVVDLEAYHVAHKPDDATPTIGWIGTPSTWNEYMEPLMPTFTSAAADGGARVVAVGAGKAASPHPLLDIVTWSEETEVTQIQAMDIGVMPLADTPWARGKCGYKLIQYMACGLPVIASPVGVNSEIVEHGVNGFLASTELEWRQALDRLLADAGLRRRMGIEGRRKVELRYSLQKWAPRLVNLLADTAGRN